VFFIFIFIFIVIFYFVCTLRAVARRYFISIFDCVL